MSSCFVGVAVVRVVVLLVFINVDGRVLWLIKVASLKGVNSAKQVKLSIERKYNEMKGI